MDGFALILVLVAAFLHATWNALIKGSDNRELTMGLITLGHGLFGAVLVALFLPPASQSWPFIAASTLIHFVYYGFLVLAYRHGDLSQVYPIARGVSPVLVALGAQVFANEILPPQAWSGILLVAFGTGFLMIARREKRATGKAIAAALMTGFTIAAYTVADGMGVRLAQSPIGYIGWLFLLESTAGFAFLWFRRETLPVTPPATWILGLTGGLISAGAYGMAIFAQSLTTLASVSAVRESSVIIAAMIGVIWFGERP